MTDSGGARSAPSGLDAPRPGRVLVPLLLGSAISLSLGVYGRGQVPNATPITTLGFSSALSMKVWLSSVVVVLALAQVASALRLFGRFGRGPVPRWVSRVHRTSGTVAVIVSAPVAFSCLWSFGFSTLDARTTAHSLLGCVFYGAFVAKLLTLRMARMPGWAVPVLGGLVFTITVALWLTSAAWYAGAVGFPAP